MAANPSSARSTLAAIFRRAIFLGLAVIIVPFAVLNRQDVTLVINPLDRGPGGEVSVPLFLLVIVPLLLGFIAGHMTARLHQINERLVAQMARFKKLRDKPEIPPLTNLPETAEATVYAVSTQEDQKKP